MNCRPNELVVIVSADGGYGLAGEVARAVIGRIARVVRLRPAQSRSCDSATVWEFEEPLLVPLGGVDYLVTGCADRVLRPLRDDPGADETFEWAGRPHYRGMHSPKPQREFAR